MQNYVTTIGLRVYNHQMERGLFARVNFDIHDDYVQAYLVSATNLSIIKRAGIKKLSIEEFNKIDHLYGDDIIFADAAFKLFSCTINGRDTDDDYSDDE